MLPFEDRSAAGRALAAALQRHAHDETLLVLGLPRGGVVVAAEVAHALRVPLDVFVVRKLGVPGFEELAMGAIASGGVQVVNLEIVRDSGITREVIDAVAAREAQELVRREREYRSNRPPLDVRGKNVIVVDDGLATGATVKAAVAALRQLHPAGIIVAVPVAAPEVRDHMELIADEVVCLEAPEPFFGVGRWYVHFDQTTDNQVRDLMARTERDLHPAHH